jgi:hypothetical protein
MAVSGAPARCLDVKCPPRVIYDFLELSPSNYCNGDNFALKHCVEFLHDFQCGTALFVESVSDRQRHSSKCSTVVLRQQTRWSLVVATLNFVFCV